MPFDQLLPPPELLGHQNAAAFRTTGADFFGYCRDLAKLPPNGHVLELGCGCGSIALALAGYLDRTGSYEGIDVHAARIEWATEQISGRFPNFRFQHANVCHVKHNPRGRTLLDHYRLPFADRTFDCVMVGSLFTHLALKAMNNYLVEMARVLKVQGHCLMAMHLLTDQCALLVESGSAIGYAATVLPRMLITHGLTLARPPLVGRWSGPRDTANYYDIVVAQKTQHMNVIRRALCRLRTVAHQSLRCKDEPSAKRQAA